MGGQTELEYEAARLLLQLVPSAQSVRFCSSGSEADQAALRFKPYFEFAEPIRKIPSHRLLALRRGEKEDVHSVKLVLRAM